MKATNHFKNTIKAYLDKRAEIDLLFFIPLLSARKEIRGLYYLYPKPSAEERLQWFPR